MAMAMAPLLDSIGPLEDDAPGPIYRKLQERLRHAIDTSVLKPREGLPAERDLAQALGVSRITVRKALDGLVEDGLLTRRQGAGTFVTPQHEKNFSQLTSFTEEMAARGLKPGARWISRELSAVTSWEILTYGLAPGSQVYRFNRVRLADDTPMSIELAIIPANCLPSLAAVGDSLYAALASAGCRPIRALQRLQAILLSADQAEILGANAGDPGLVVERRGFLADGRIAEVSHSYYRGDTYHFVAELRDG